MSNKQLTVEEELKELFESGAMLHRNYAGHEQFLMNEGTFVELVQQYASLRLSEKQGEIEELKRQIEWLNDDKCNVCNPPSDDEIEEEVYKNIRLLPGDCSKYDAERVGFKMAVWMRDKLLPK